MGSRMGRDALVVDIAVARLGGGMRFGRVEKEVLRVINTHLESHPEGLAARMSQMEILGRLLKQPGVIAGVVAGDMNAITREDEVLPGRCGLGDAWDFVPGRRMERNGRGVGWYEDNWVGRRMEEGVSRVRRDRVLYTGNVGFVGGGVVGGKVLKRIGVGLRCEGVGREYDGMGRGGGVAVSNHCGLATHVVVGGRQRGMKEVRRRTGRVEMDDFGVRYGERRRDMW